MYEFQDSFAINVSFSNLWAGWHVGDYPIDDLPKFGYAPEKIVQKPRFHAIVWWHATT